MTSPQAAAAAGQTPPPHPPPPPLSVPAALAAMAESVRRGAFEEVKRLHETDAP